MYDYVSSQVKDLGASVRFYEVHRPMCSVAMAVEFSEYAGTDYSHRKGVGRSRA
jgi:hypothetical protein